MLEAKEGLQLTFQAATIACGGERASEKPLHRYAAARTQLARAIDDPLPSSADFFEQLIGTQASVGACRLGLQELIHPRVGWIVEL